MEGVDAPSSAAAAAPPIVNVANTSNKPSASEPGSAVTIAPPTKKKAKSGGRAANAKRRCVSTACIACRRRKSKCDGALPACAACASVYGTECVYDPNSDHRRKGVYRDRVDALKTKSSTLQILIQAILNASEEDVPALVQQIRTCESLDDIAEQVIKQQQGLEEEGEEYNDTHQSNESPTFETEIAGKMGELRLENGSVRFLGGTSNLLCIPPVEVEDATSGSLGADEYTHEDPITSWTRVTTDRDVIVHLINMYFTWHYPFFTTLSKSLFYQDFLQGKPAHQPKRTMYCSSLLVNAMLALGCHFTSLPAACADPNDSSTKGDAFFQEAKRLIVENDEYEKPRLTTVQALALMSVREAGCGREQKGWVYSGMSFRMAQDMGLNLEYGGMTTGEPMDEYEIDARRITFWGCFQFDKCWSNYLGRIPQLPAANITAQKFDVFPGEDADLWTQYTDNGLYKAGSQPSRTRAVALQISALCEISSDLILFFYNPQFLGKPSSKAAEMKKLGELQTRLEAWRKDLPKEMEPREGQMPQVLLLHMFFHLLYIHLFRPFLKYSPTQSPLPAHVSPRRQCIQAAASISKLMRLYKRSYGLRQICNIAVYMVHSACTIHLFNLSDKTAKRDIIHGVKNLEEIAEDWLCARRTLSMLSAQARKWKIDLPEEAAAVLARTDVRYGSYSTADIPSPSPKVDAVHSPLSTASMSPMMVSSTNLPQPLQTGDLAGATPLRNGPAAQAPNKSSFSNYLQEPQQLQGIGQPQTPVPITATTMVPLSQSHPAPRVAAAIRQHHQFSSIPQTAVTPSSSTGISPVQPPNTPGLRHKQMLSASSASDAFSDNQQWWLRDQASLLNDFDNWEGIDMGNDLSGVAMPGVPDQRQEYYSPVNSLNMNSGGNIISPKNGGSGMGGNLNNDEWFFG